jgi:hypothetical protein
VPVHRLNHTAAPKLENFLEVPFTPELKATLLKLLGLMGVALIAVVWAVI